MRSIRSLFRKSAQPKARLGRCRPAALPDVVLEVIDGAGIARRSDGEDGAPRMVVHLPGWQPFIFTVEKAAGVMGKVFPELTDDEVQQAARRLRSRVAARLRLLDAAAADDGATRNWALNY